MAYPSAKIQISATATANAADVAKVGGKKTLTINNHLIQTVAIAQTIANAYLAEYKDQKTVMKITKPTPLPYEVRDNLETIVGIGTCKFDTASVGFDIGTFSGSSIIMKIRKIAIRFMGGKYDSDIELED